MEIFLEETENAGWLCARVDVMARTEGSIPKVERHLTQAREMRNWRVWTSKVRRVIAVKSIRDSRVKSQSDLWFVTWEKRQLDTVRRACIFLGTSSHQKSKQESKPQLSQSIMSTEVMLAIYFGSQSCKVRPVLFFFQVSRFIEIT